MSDPLRRYQRVLDGDEEAKYLLSKRSRVDVKLNATPQVLWREHEKALKAGYEAEGRTSLLDLKVELAARILEACVLCERRCGTNRKAGMKGHCGVLESRISSEFLHMGEEPELVPSYTIFFSGCTFNCVFCQNWDISTRPEGGAAVDPEKMARMIEAKLPRRRHPAMTDSAKNVNWVGGDPTSNLPFILKVLRETEANLPQVWNSNMYLTEESMSLLDGVVDVYLTDFKYGNDDCAMRLSNAPDYMRIVTRNHLLARQNGEMIVRHLVLPGHIDCCTKPVLRWIAENLRDVKVNVMSQYRPAHNAADYEDIARPLRLSEYKKAIEVAEALHLDLTE